MSAMVITITSGKGGVGKTTATANLGVSLAMLGQRVVTIDADIGLRNLDVVMGLENRIVYDLVDAVEGHCRLRQALIRDKRLSELYLMPAAQTRDKTAVSPEQMIEITDQLRPDFDFVLIDSPAGIERGYQNAIAPADRVIIVTTPEVSAVRDADRIVGLVEAEEKGPATLIINRLNPDMVRRGQMLSTEDVVDLLAIDLLGIIPEDKQVIIATNQGSPVALDGKAPSGQAFRNVAGRLLGQNIPLMPLKSSDGMFGRLGRFIRGSEQADEQSGRDRGVFQSRPSATSHNLPGGSMGFLNRLFGQKQPTSREIAKERLQLVLVQDRFQISPDTLDRLKDELIKVISRYVEIEADGVEVNFTQTKYQSRLVADIPVVGAVRQSTGRRTSRGAGGNG